MPEISATAKARIEAQGFVGYDAPTLARINYWLRLSPAICLTWTTTGIVLASPMILWALVPFALAGGVWRGHPFDAVYNHALRHLFKTPPLPPYGRPRRFACLAASVMISVMAVGFQFGRPLIGYALGGLLGALATVNVTTGFCVPSFIYGLIFGKTYCELTAKDN